MGLLRLFLALSVVVVHAYPVLGFHLIASNVAVHSFFIISGFYMAFILNEKYIGKNGSYRLFITNRLLRIYPLYWVILFLLFALTLIEFVFFPSPNNALRMLLQYATETPNYSLTLIMAVLRNITLIFTTDFFQNNFHTTGYLLILPAWTLIIELLFYLIAPFIVRLRIGFILVLTLFFGSITFGSLFPFFQQDSGVTDVFVSKFVYFLFGIISYQIYRKLHTTDVLKTYSKKVVLIFSIGTLLFGYLSNVGSPLEKSTIIIFFYYLLLMLSIPFLFSYSKKNLFDKSLADLSYPVYLSHILVFKVIANSPFMGFSPTLITLLTIAATLGFSYVLVKTVELPIDRLRKKMLE